MSNDSNQTLPEQYASVWTALYEPETAMPKTMISIVRNYWVALTKDPERMEEVNQHLTESDRKLLSRWVEGPYGIPAELFLKACGLLILSKSMLSVFDEDLGVLLDFV